MALGITVLDGSRQDVEGFTCGVPALDDYLRRLAGPYQREGLATTHVLIEEAEPARILGYCSLSAAQLRMQALPEEERKQLPVYALPVIRMRRLAISCGEQSRGHGRLLVGHAVRLALSMRQAMGVRGLVVDADDAPATAFYEGFGFRRTGGGAPTLYLPVGDS